MNAYRAWYRSLPPYRKFFFAFGVCLPIAAVGYEVLRFLDVL